MYRLYWAPLTAAFAPQAVLEEAGVSYEREILDLKVKREQGSPAYLALNPGGTIPTLVTPEGTVLTESAAIMLSLAERYPETGLLPAPGTAERERLLRWLFYLTNCVQEAYRRYYYAERYSTDPADAPRIKARARADLLARWAPIETLLGDPGPFVLGAGYSAADLYLVMLATWFDPREALLDRHPNIKRCTELAAQRPALRRTLESHGLL